MHMEITAHGFVMRRTLRADIAREIGRYVQAVQQPIKNVSVDLYKERQRTMRVVNKYCRVHVEFLNDVCETASDAERDFPAAVSEAFLKLLRIDAGVLRAPGDSN
jgi:hypothetical protein